MLQLQEEVLNVQGLLVKKKKKKSVESNVATSKKKMDDEWDAKVLCPIEEDELVLMAKMGEHIDYEDDWIIESGCSNNMAGDQSGAMEAG